MTPSTTAYHCLECDAAPVVTGECVGYMAWCGCYDGCSDGNHGLIGEGSTPAEAVADWREAMLADDRMVISATELEASREVWAAETEMTDAPVDFHEWLRARSGAA